ncbi:MAG: 4-hydroxy-tetrahydrodipicolinate synthase, partial [Mixta calida]|nr:4-hydroxy-tetrahydrodipicolinate synthase [Mixta calida]
MFTGSIVALVTPMDDKGNVCRTSLKKLIDYHVESGTSAIVSVGTTGESATLSHDEHGDVVMLTLDLADGRIPVIAGTGANATAEGISLTKRFENSGVIGCLTVTPYYNRPTQEGLYQHFKAISESTELPQMLYNVPSRTGCDMLPETVARLAKIKNIIGIKEATGNLSRVSQIQELVDDEFVLVSGDDATALDFMQLGGHGVISVTANIAAREMAELCRLAREGNFAEARHLNQRL